MWFSVTHCIGGSNYASTKLKHIRLMYSSTLSKLNSVQNTTALSERCMRKIFGKKNSFRYPTGMLCIKCSGLWPFQQSYLPWNLLEQESPDSGT